MNTRIGHFIILSPRQETKLELRLLQISGGITESIFPEAEALLRKDENIKAFFWITGDRETIYRSIMDYFFAHLFFWRRFEIRLFYKEKGPPLRIYLTKKETEEINKFFIKAIYLIRNLYEKESIFNEWYDIHALLHEEIESLRKNEQRSA